MDVDVLAASITRASATMIIAMLNWIDSVSARQGLNVYFPNTNIFNDYR